MVGYAHSACDPDRDLQCSVAFVVHCVELATIQGAHHFAIIVYGSDVRSGVQTSVLQSRWRLASNSQGVQGEPSFLRIATQA